MDYAELQGVSAVEASVRPIRTRRPVQGPSKREEQKAQTRRRLLSAALKVLGTTRYSTMSVDDIVREAGVTRPTFYLYFSSKYDILITLFDDLVPDLQRAYVRLDADILDGNMEGVKDWIRKALGYWERNEPLLRAMHDASACEISPVHQTVGQAPPFNDALPHVVASWPPGRRAEAHARVRLMLFLLDQTWTFWKGGGFIVELTLDEVVSLMADIWFKSVAPPQA